jgi:catechol 2,3-dioxygenase-like lactoylglutathione lyase family enzyme
MTKINGIAEAALYVTDLDRAAAFYQEALGLPLTASFNNARFLQTGRDSTLILFNPEGIRRRQSVIPSHGAIGEGHVALAVPFSEIDDWRERLKDHGVTIELEQKWSFGSRSLYFRDPDNNSVELISDDHYPLNWRQHFSSTSND